MTLLRRAWVVSFCLFLACAATAALLAEKTTEIDAAGFVHEPLFGLIPIGYLLLIVALVLAGYERLLKLINTRRNRC